MAEQHDCGDHVLCGSLPLQSLQDCLSMYAHIGVCARGQAVCLQHTACRLPSLLVWQSVMPCFTQSLSLRVSLHLSCWYLVLITGAAVAAGGAVKAGIAGTGAAGENGAA